MEGDFQARRPQWKMNVNSWEFAKLALQYL